jgi:hypothetical protein
VGLKPYFLIADTPQGSASVAWITTTREASVRKTVMILVLLSAFAMTRNVLLVSAAAPSDATTDITAAAPDRAPQFPLLGVSPDPAAHAPGTLSLFVAGLAGLMAAGGRRADRQRSSA